MQYLHENTINILTFTVQFFWCCAMTTVFAGYALKLLSLKIKVCNLRNLRVGAWQVNW